MALSITSDSAVCLTAVHTTALFLSLSWYMLKRGGRNQQPWFDFSLF